MWRILCTVGIHRLKFDKGPIVAGHHYHSAWRCDRCGRLS